MNTVKLMNEKHPSFNLNQAWFTFGIFENQKITKMLLVHAKNKLAVHFLESIVSNDGSVNDTCSVMYVSEKKPQVRSSLTDQVSYCDFVVDIVESGRWVIHPFLSRMFDKSISDVEKADVSIRVNSMIRHLKWEEKNNRAKDVVVDIKSDQLKSGLIGLGFDKLSVNKFVESVKSVDKPLQTLLKEGISELS